MNTRNDPKSFKFAKWAIWFFLVLTILLLVFTYYRAEIIFQGQDNAKYLKYYAISLFGIIFWGVILRLNDGIKLNVAIITISTFLGFYLLEILIHFTTPSDLRIAKELSTAAHERGIKVDERDIFQIYKDMRSEGLDAIPYSSPINFQNGIALGDQKFLLPLGGGIRENYYW